jgi:hypothetical protein
MINVICVERKLTQTSKAAKRAITIAVTTMLNSM